MKCHLQFTLCLFAALAAGCFAGYKFGQRVPVSEQAPSSPEGPSTKSRLARVNENNQSEDQTYKAFSLYSLRRLERGEIQPLKEFLASRLAYFYLSYGPADHPRKHLDKTGLQLLNDIRDFSESNDILQAALKRRAGDFPK